MYWIYVGIWDIYWIYIGYRWDIDGIKMEYMGHIWDTYWIHMGYIQAIYPTGKRIPARDDVVGLAAAERT